MDHTNLFIGDLARECTEDDLFRAFAEYGVVVDIQIKRSKLTKLIEKVIIF